MNKLDLSDYICARQEELKSLTEEISFLEKIQQPLTIVTNYDVTRDTHSTIQLYSEDYTLATHIKLEKRSNYISGTGYVDGGYHTTNHEIYPQFYFLIEHNFKDASNVPILIWHKGFETDENIILRRYHVTQAWGDYDEMNNIVEKPIDRNKVVSFFKSKGVNKTLTDTLQQKIDEYYKMF